MTLEVIWKQAKSMTLKVYRKNCHSDLHPLASADCNTNDDCKKSSLAIVVIIWKPLKSYQNASSVTITE